ncbi:type VI secretion system tip protein VgrG [Sorangium sp. So ce1097]|uniref:type VI secretion system tip protein VgrG n=1 Tax=Sorangium sp. So ce1097 TaxID=3133330 RepID=UPI003F5DE0F6
MPAVTPTILSDGKPMDPAYELLSIDIRREVDRIPRAELRVLDGDAAQQKFAISDTGFFAPGAKIEIKLRYEGEEDRCVFKGVVVRHGVEVDDDGSVLVIGLKDAAVKLTGARRSAVFRKMTDGAIVKQLIEAAELEVGTIAETRPEHAEMVQYHATPWDFILSRAGALGLLVVVEDGKVSLRKTALSGAPKHCFSYGISEIFDVEIEADAEHQYEAVESVAWDPKEQKPTPARKAKSAHATQGNLDGGKLGGAVGNGTCTLSHPVPVVAEELQAWADARMARSRMALLRGRIAVPGFGDIGLLDVMEVEGIGKRFNGTTLVTGLRHRVDASGRWRTDVQFGLSPEELSRKEEFREAPAAGLLPAVSGLQIGVVADFEDDPDEELRVKVILPGVDAKQDKAVWARLAAPDAGKARGYFFRPEPKDEVVVGFFNDDPRRPVILGALFGSKNAPPEAMGKPSKKNDKSGIVTKFGTTIQLLDPDENKASVSIETANKNKLLIDDGAKSIVLSDQHKNSITMGEGGIEIKSKKDLNLKIDGNVTISGKKVDIK